MLRMSCYEEQREFSLWLEGEGDAPPSGIERARAAVHRNTVVGTLVEALAESFPVTRAMAGGDFFDAMARARVLAEPPVSPVLAEYAISFPDFVAGFDAARDFPVLAEMAMLEALRMRAFHAADATAVGLEPFHRLACDAALLEVTGAVLHPAAHWVEARHALVELWQAHDAAEDCTRVDLGGIDAATPQQLLVHRPRFEVRLRALPDGGLAFLDALAGGASFADAFVAASRAQELAEPASLFSLLLHEGLVVQFTHLPSDPP
jgi:hypothetical protein